MINLYAHPDKGAVKRLVTNDKMGKLKLQMVSYRGALIQGAMGGGPNGKGESSARGSTRHGNGSHNAHRYTKGKSESDRVMGQYKWKAHGEQSINGGSGKYAERTGNVTTHAPIESLDTVVGTDSISAEVGLTFSDHGMQMLEAFLGDNSNEEKGEMGMDLNDQQEEGEVEGASSAMIRRDRIGEAEIREQIKTGLAVEAGLKPVGVELQAAVSEGEVAKTKVPETMGESIDVELEKILVSAEEDTTCPLGERIVESQLGDVTVNREKQVNREGME